MTEAEKKIWYALSKKQLGVKFRRQQPTSKYMVDFVCFERNIVIEIDGGHHFGSSRDRIRVKWLREHGYEVIRFWNHDVLKSTDGVKEKIIGEISPSLCPRPSREGKTSEYVIGSREVDG
jgi:very-short-patch-repair endonuclease